jgi:hypothetical protein
MSTHAALRQPQRRRIALHVVPGTLAKSDAREASLTAIGHELSERVMAIGNYLEAASRLCEVGPTAVFAPHSAEMLQKALTQTQEAGRAIRQLRKVLTGEGPGHPTALRSQQNSCNPAYRVHFINRFARGSAVIRACQRTIPIRSARSPERAIEAAKKRFARVERIHDWNIHAQIVELEVIQAATSAR